MSGNDRITRITRLLNKNFYNMTFDDKKKVLNLVIAEEECDDLLIRFLARQYNVDFEEEKQNLIELASQFNVNLSKFIRGLPNRFEKLDNVLDAKERKIVELNTKYRMAQDKIDKLNKKIEDNSF